MEHRNSIAQKQFSRRVNFYSPEEDFTLFTAQKAAGRPVPSAAALSPQERKSDYRAFVPPSADGQSSTNFSQLARKKHFRIWLAGSMLCLLLLLGGVVWWLRMTATPAVVLYHTGQPRNVTLSIGGGGIVFPQKQLTITYPEAERVIAVKVKPGDRVTVNQPLLQLDPALFSLALKQAQDDVDAAQNYLNSVQGSGNAVTIAQAQQDLDRARSRYNTLSAQASSSMLHNGLLTAPMEGIVTTVNVTPGAVFNADMPLLTIMDLSTVVVHVKVPLSYLGQVQVQQKAEVMPSATSHLTFAGTVTSVIPQADPQTDTFEAWISVDNKEGRILPGMSAFARIQGQVNALAVPRLAVLAPEGDAAVFVVRNQVAHLRRVQVVGRTVDTIYIAGNDLIPGEQIVLVGLHALQDGQRVRVTRIEGRAS
ncbi:MAG: efflux RND transporter periplasmic adaptor subunit [Ktedonobacteraceae bacterium]|nr:efflux RND transporter periplasmic adaptor subunit [Ktedonobacteraceae bacterium]